MILLSLFVQGVKIKKEGEGMELDLSGKEKAQGKALDDAEKGETSAVKKEKANEEISSSAPETPKKDPKVEQTLVEARSAIERKKSIIQQQSQVTKDEEERARALEREEQKRQSVGERQQQQPMPRLETRSTHSGSSTPVREREISAPPSELQYETETEEEMEKRLREKQIQVESQREQRAVKRRESEAVMRAERALSVDAE